MEKIGRATLHFGRLIVEWAVYHDSPGYRLVQECTDEEGRMLRSPMGDPYPDLTALTQKVQAMGCDSFTVEIG